MEIEEVFLIITVNNTIVTLITRTLELRSGNLKQGAGNFGKGSEVSI